MRMSASIVFGYRYGETTPFRRHCVLNGDPGSRAPHVFVDGVSTITFFGRGFVLLAGDPRWIEATRALRPRVAVHLLNGWQSTYGVEPTGATLVRPDGVVAARFERIADDPSGALEHALTETLRSGWSAPGRR